MEPDATSSPPVRSRARTWLVIVLVLLFASVAANLVLTIGLVDASDRAKDAQVQARADHASASKWRKRSQAFEDEADDASRDVKDLTNRQRKLAAEKASVEDQREQLKVAVTELLACTVAIAEAADAYSNGDYSWDVSSMQSQCEAAGNAVQAAGIMEE